MISEYQQQKFTNASLRGLEQALRTPSLAGYIGESVVQDLKDAQERCVPVLWIDGIIDLSQIGSDEIPFSVVEPGSQFRFRIGESPVFSKRQEPLVESTLGKISSSGLLLNGNLSGDEALRITDEQLHSELAEQQTQIVMRPNSSGLTNAVRSSVLSVSDGQIISGVMKILGRPALAFPITKEKRVEPDIISHELTHVFQKEAFPVRQFTSQQQIEETGIRDEFEAYHNGAMVRRAISNIDDSRFARMLSSGLDVFRGKYFQIFIDTLRQLNASSEDPFMPTPELMNNFASNKIDPRYLMSGYFDIQAVLDHYAKI